MYITVDNQHDKIHIMYTIYWYKKKKKNKQTTGKRNRVIIIFPSYNTNLTSSSMYSEDCGMHHNTKMY
jgi:uncharacterized protein YcfL